MAKKGRLELDSDLSIQKFDKQQRQVYRVTFTAFKIGLYDLVVKYDGQVVPGKLSYRYIELVFKYCHSTCPAFEPFGT